MRGCPYKWSFYFGFVISLGVTQNIIPVVFLAIDFLLRASDYSKYSLVGISSKGIVRYFGISENIINAGPKYLQHAWVLYSAPLLYFFIFGAWSACFVIGRILGLFSFLEAAFGLCVACEIYPFVYRFLYKVKFQ